MLIPSLFHNIVGVRVRPLTPRELAAPTRSRGGPAAHFLHKKSDPSDANAWTIEKNTIMQRNARKVQGRSVFSFDDIFQPDDTTQQVYETMVQPLVSGLVGGQNGTVFLYGQTSSGKTFTMQGNTSTTNEIGIVQLVASDLFQDIQQQSQNREFSVSVSFIEIYNEKVRDLLSSYPSGDDNEQKSTTTTKSRTGNNGSTAHHQNSSNDLKSLVVREDSKRGRVFVNSNEWPVETANGIVEALHHGSKKRASSSTAMNDRSSRSHAIFRITVESREKENDRVVRVSTLNLVDLAGSENGHQSSGSHRQREGGKINQRYVHVMIWCLCCLCRFLTLLIASLLCSLLALSQVIHALSTQTDRPAYINYRNSKLTRLLQPYLSGNAFITVLCCVTLSKLYVEETRSTLKFASRAKLVTTKPTVNEVMDDTAMIQKLESDLKQARRDIEQLEKREQAAEQGTQEAMQEFQKLKAMIFGSGELPQFQSDAIAPQQQQQQATTPIKGEFKEKEIVMTHSETSDTTGTPPWDEGSHADDSRHDEKFDYAVRTAPVSPSPARHLPNPPLSTKPKAYSRSRSHDTPPTEVVILRDPVPSPLKVENQSMVYKSELVAAQERADFLGQKLDATEDLVESLFKDVESARGCIHTLVFKNVSLASRVEKLTRQLREENEGRDELMLQQYRVLKYSMYIGLFFFLIGSHELYFAVVIFLWLCLEVVT